MFRKPAKIKSKFVLRYQVPLERPSSRARELTCALLLKLTHQKFSIRRSSESTLGKISSSVFYLFYHFEEAIAKNNVCAISCETRKHIYRKCQKVTKTPSRLILEFLLAIDPIFTKIEQLETWTSRT